MTAHVPPPASVDLDQAGRFLAKAVPWPKNAEGYINITWSEKKPETEQTIWSGRACRTLDQAVGALTWITNKPGKRELYVCMSSQRMAREKVSKKGHKYLAPIRNQQNVSALKALYLDIDFKGGEHGYDTYNDAINAIAGFLEATGLPKPSMIVKSGGGLHIYFTFTHPLSREEWQPLAHALTEAGKWHGLKADWQVTTDSARILRIPGTTNNKQAVPRPVTLAILKDFDCDPAILAGALKPYAREARPTGEPFIIDPTLFPPRSPLPPEFRDELGAGISKPEYDPIHLDDLAKECAFIREAIATGGATYTNPMWNLTTLAATFSDDSRNDAHRMGNKHPQYTEESTDELLGRKQREREEKGLGFPTCAAIANAGCTLCQSCPHFSKGRSPLSALPPRVTMTTTARRSTTSDPLDFYKLPIAEVVNRLNEQHFVLRSSGKIYRQGEEGELTAIQKSDFRTALGGRLAYFGDDEDKTRSAADAWLRSPHRREYAGLEYCPDNRGARPNFKNVWFGWGIEPAQGNCAVVLDHVHEIVAAGDDDKANYLLDWIADIVQNPTRKPGVAPILRGSQGTGKSSITQILAHILGRRNVLITSDKDRILGKFNSGLLNKILLIGEEMLFAGDRATTDKLKHLVTGDTFPIEFKFGDVLEVKSCHRLILTSNHEQVIQAASEERRFVTFDVSDSKRGDTRYFDRLYAVTDGRDDTTAAAFVHHLQTRDISEFKPWKAQQLFAGDEALQKQKLLSLAPPLMWLREIIDTVDGQGGPVDYEWFDGLPYPKAHTYGTDRVCKWPPRFPRSQALDGFRAWCTKAKPYGASEFTGSPERFWREIHKIIPKAQTSRQTAKGIRVVSIDLVDLSANFKKYLRGEPL